MGGTSGKKPARSGRGQKRKGKKKSTPAQPARPVLGNDPFTRGAATRGEPAPEAREPAPSRATAGSPTAPPTAEPQPTGAKPAAPTAPPLRPPPPVARLAANEPVAPPAPVVPAPARRSAPAPSGPTAAASAQARLAALEARLDAALGGLEHRLSAIADRAGLSGARHELGEALARALPAVRARLATALDLARLLEPPERLDRFGMDSRFAERASPLVELLYGTWWRTTVREIGNVPSTGPVIVVANHAGLIPWDALVLQHAVSREHPARRDLRPLLDDRECDLPLIGSIAIRLGAVRAAPDAAERILREDGVVGVFPEGSAGARKPWRDRYRIQRFGRGGFVKLALRTNAAIVPCAIVGSEEAAPGISRTGWLADRLGVPLLAASPLLRIGPAAAIPLPSKWTLRFGPPIPLGGATPEDAADGAVVNALTERVRGTLQAMLDEDVAARSSVFL